MRHAVWRTRLTEDCEMLDWPTTCASCDEQTMARHGCGWRDDTRGRGEAMHASRRGERISTCPQWLAVQPAVAEVYEMLGDYTRGAIGDVRDMPNALLCALRAAHAEVSVWESVQQRALMDRRRHG